MFKPLSKALNQRGSTLGSIQIRRIQIEKIIQKTLEEEFGPLAKNLKPVVSYKTSSQEVIIELGNKVFLSEVRAKLPILVKALREDSHNVNLIIRS